MAIGTSLVNVPLIVKGITLVVMLVGMLVLPLLPGLVIIWLAALICWLVVGFNTLGWVVFAVLTVFMLASLVLENVLMGASAHKEGAAWWGILLALVAAIIGSFVIPVPILGGVLAALATLFVIEWIRRKDWRKALLSIKGMLIGWGWSLLFRFIIGVIMIGLWLVWAWV